MRLEKSFKKILQVEEKALTLRSRFRVADNGLVTKSSLRNNMPGLKAHDGK